MGRIVIDQGRCVGHGQCAMMAPEAFDLDADGYAVVLTEEVEGAQLRDAQGAAQACPEQAITIAE